MRDSRGEKKLFFAQENSSGGRKRKGIFFPAGKRQKVARLYQSSDRGVTGKKEMRTSGPEPKGIYLSPEGKKNNHTEDFFPSERGRGFLFCFLRPPLVTPLWGVPSFPGRVAFVWKGALPFSPFFFSSLERERKKREFPFLKRKSAPCPPAPARKKKEYLR